MTYQVLARKWRPQTFEEVIGQDHITRTLQNAISTGRIGHAYLFCGPRGVGKTTVARILAKALNCQEGPTPTPCNRCSLCQEITEDRSLDVLEIDGASNTGVDHIRKLREQVAYAPTQARYKVYIIDEIHMLSDSAFNALLKTLEEPPAHVIFIFATTEPQKIPATIQSRCQRFDFRRITTKQIIQRLFHIVGQDQLRVEEGALAIIARRAEGSMRDGLSLLDQVVSYGGEQITEQLVSEALGLAGREMFFELLETTRAGHSKEALQLIASVEEHGWDMEDFTSGLEEHLRLLLLAHIDPRSPELADLSQADRERYIQQSELLPEEDLLRMLAQVSETGSRLRYSDRPRFLLEMLAVKLAKMDSTVHLKELLDGLDHLLGKSPATGNHAAEKTSDEEPPPSARPVQAAPQADTASPDLWGQVVDRVTRKKSGLGALLQHGQLGELQERVLTISFPKSCNFHRERAQTQPNREVIESEASAVLGRDVRVRFTLAEGIEMEKSRPPGSESKADPSSAEEIVKAEPIIGYIMETLDGEIIK